jgi:homoserine acetyltransferase
MLWLMSSNPVQRQQQTGTLRKTDEELDKFVSDYVKTGDANDMLYALEASHDYDPAPGLEKIRAPLVAINFADDLINPPELGSSSARRSGCGTAARSRFHSARKRAATAATRSRHSGARNSRRC